MDGKRPLNYGRPGPDNRLQTRDMLWIFIFAAWFCTAMLACLFWWSLYRGVFR
jgi:hypothetical protein